MSTATKPGSGTQTGLAPDEKAWLGRYLGTRVPWETKVVDDGVEVDAAEAYAKLKEYEQNAKDGEQFEGVVVLEMDLLRSNLREVGIPSSVDQGDDFDSNRSKKDEALKQVRDLIELQKAEIASGTDLTYTVKGKTIPLKKKVKSKNKGDASKEYSDVHHKDQTVEEQGPTPQQKATLKLVMSQLEALTEKLRDNVDAGFSPNELMDEIWTPLVREQIISEHQCPSEFSRILQLWQGANALYKERCKEKAREEVESYATARGALQDLDEALGVGAAVVDVVLTALGTGAKSQEILKLVSKCARAGVNLASSALAKDMEGCSSQVGNILAAAVPDPWGKVSKGAFLAAANGGLIAHKLSQRDNEGAAALIGDAVSNAFTAVGAGTGQSDILDKVGGHLSKGITTAIKGRKIYALLQAEPVDSKAVMIAVGQLVENEVKRAVGELVADLKHDKEKEDLKKELTSGDKPLKEDSDAYKEKMKNLEEKQEKEATNIDDAVVIGSLNEQLAGILGQKGMLGVKLDEEEIAKRAIEAGAEQTNAELEAAQVNYTKSLSIVMGVGVGADDEDAALMAGMYDIDKLIAQIEADRAQLQLLNAILDAVGGVLTLVIPQLGGILKAKQFAMNVVAAVRRSQELLTFTSLVSDAKKATSPQAHALLSEVDELKHQLTNDTIDAALNLGQAICITGAAAADMSGIGAGAGAGLKGAATGLDALGKAKDLLYRKFKERKVKRAWQRYRQALDNPEDRIAIIKAIRKNPTLAKYAIAYGALEMNDPFAKKALSECGLNDAVLASENTSSEKVVRYLETKFADDIQVVGVVSVFAPDSGEPLTLASWIKNKTAAKKADGKVMLGDTPPTNNIDQAFAALDKSASGVDGEDIGDSPDYAAWTTHRENLLALSTALRAFQPKSTTSLPFAEFKDYLNELAFASESEAKRLQAEMDAEKVAREKAGQVYDKIVADANSAITALNLAKGNVGLANTSRTPDEIITYCTTGDGKTLVGALKPLALSSPMLSDPVGLLVEAVLFAGKRAAKAKKGTGPEVGTQMQAAVQSLIAELNTASTALTKCRDDATTSKTALALAP